MGRFFQDLDYPHFDYHLGQCEQLPGWEFRGPIPDIAEPFFVCIGASQMFGRFCHDPYAQLLSRAIDLPVMNLGLSGSGPGAFLEEGFMTVINRAQFAIVQVMSARCESNSDFEGSKTGGAAGIHRRDGTSMLFDAYVADKLANSSRSSVTRAVEELRASWVSHFRELLNAIRVPKVLHWFSTTTPRRSDDYSAWWKLLGPFPQLVNKRMLYQIIPFADSYIQTAANLGLPQTLWPASEAVDGTELYDGRLLNNYYPSPQMHDAAARDLLGVSRALRMRSSLADAGAKLGPKDVVVVSVNEFEGAIIAELFGAKAISIPYQRLIEDRGLLPFLAARKPCFIHVKRRSLLEGFLDAMSARRNASSTSPTYVDPVAFAAYVHASATGERRINSDCKDADLTEVHFEDLTADPKAIIARLAAFTQHPEPSSASVSAALSRIHPPRTAQNPDELQALFNRALRHLPKPGE
jgi:hypothetical protein